jgi:hypothetical protein
MQTKNKDQKGQTPNKKSNWLYWGLGIITTGVLSFFGYKYYKDNFSDKETVKDLPEVDDTKTDNQPPHTAAPKKTNSPKQTVKVEQAPKDDFPLKKGSKGARVKTLQETIIAKYGKALLPKFGADGDFGSETENALKKLNIPLSIDETTFNVLVKTSQLNHGEIAKGLFNAASKKDFNASINLLKTLKTVEDYKTVSEQFKTYRLQGGVRQTLVNGMLNTFKEDKQKDTLRFVFAGMGLKYNGQQWSLSGFPLRAMLITTTPTRVWKTPNESVEVPKDMVLGYAIETKKGYTLFENENAYYLVPTHHITTYK